MGLRSWLIVPADSEAKLRAALGVNKDGAYYLRYCLAFELYRDRFAHHKVDPRLVESLLQKVSSWTKDGILVYGVRIPSSRDMENLEDRSSGLDYAKFSRTFRKVGGLWIESDGDRYHSYDGSHLRGDAATQYSTWLAETMKTGFRN